MNLLPEEKIRNYKSETSITPIKTKLAITRHKEKKKIMVAHN